jgi:serine/threonine-protein kinase RsbW
MDEDTSEGLIPAIPLQHRVDVSTTEHKPTGTEASAGRSWIGGEPLVVLTIPAKPEYITLGRLALSGLSRARALSDEALADLKLALTEACTNVVRHAYAEGAGRVEIRYELCDDRVAIEVRDDGAGFDPRAERGDGDAPHEGGLGIAIIRAIADELEIGVGPGGRGSRLRFVKLLAD